MAASTDELIIPSFTLRAEEAPEVAERFMTEVVARPLTQPSHELVVAFSHF